MSCGCVERAHNFQGDFIYPGELPGGAAGQRGNKKGTGSEVRTPGLVSHLRYLQVTYITFSKLFNFISEPMSLSIDRESVEPIVSVYMICMN